MISQSTESTISTSLILQIASEEKSEQELTWVLNLIFQHENVEGVRNLSNLSLCCTAMEFCGISAGRKEFMVDGLPADIGIGIVLPIRSSQVSLYFSALGFHLWHFHSWSEEFLDKGVCDESNLGRGLPKNVSLCPRQILCIKWHASIAAQHRSRTWSDCPLAGNVRIFSTAIRFKILKFS